MSARLTAEQRQTLNDAEQILVGLLSDPEETFMFSLHGEWNRLSATYFTPGGIQVSSLWDARDDTLAGKIQQALDIRADEEGHAEEVRAAKVASLRAQLASLTGEAA